MKKILFLSIFLPLCGFAQDLSTEVVVDRTVVVDLPEASPLPGVGPALSLPQRDSHNLQLSDYTLAADFAPGVVRTATPPFTGIAVPPAYRGFAWLGYFPTYNLGAGVGYKVLDSAADRLNVAAGFEGASWHGLGNSETKPSQRYNSFDILADYSHIFKSGLKLYAKADYGHDALSVPYFSTIVGDAPQSYDHAAFEAGVAREGNISYEARAFYRLFIVNDKVFTWSPYASVSGSLAYPGARESHFGVDGSLSVRMRSTSVFRLGIEVEGFNTRGFFPRYSDIGERDVHAWNIGLDPSFRFSAGNFDVRLGLQVDFSEHTDGFEFRIAPDCGVVWHAAGWAEVYAEATGGQRYNSLYDIYNYSVFAPGSSVYETMSTRIDFLAGIRLGSFGGFSADIHGGYADTEDVPMPGVFVYSDGRAVSCFAGRHVYGWRAGASFSYSYADIVKARVDADLYPHGEGRGYWQNIDNARAAINAQVTVKATDRLSVGLAYKLRSRRAAYYGYDNTTLYDLGNIYDLGVNATYRFSDRLSFFGRFDNLLAHRYLIMPGIQSQRVHGLVGATYMF